MLRKNKLSIFLLAVLVMLTVYYVNQKPTEVVNGGDDTIDPVTRYASYAQKRIELTTIRTQEIVELETTISVSADINVINQSREKMQQLEQLTMQEIMLEDSVISLGYDDCLVIKSDKEVKIDILTNVFTVNEFIEIANLAKISFDQKVTVTVNVTSKGI